MIVRGDLALLSPLIYLAFFTCGIALALHVHGPLLYEDGLSGGIRLFAMVRRRTIRDRETIKESGC